MQLLTADAILTADDLQREKVEVPQWGGFVYLQSMTGDQRQDFEEDWAKANKEGRTAVVHCRARLVALIACDEQGHAIFTAQHITELSKKSCVPLDKLFTVGMRLNGLTDADVKEIAGNSPGGQDA